jgi:dTDP-D-glucose 4,6-dehydratase
MWPLNYHTSHLTPHTSAMIQVTMHGNGENKRNFLYVEDVARAFEIILFKVIIPPT